MTQELKDFISSIKKEDIKGRDTEAGIKAKAKAFFFSREHNGVEVVFFGTKMYNICDFLGYLFDGSIYNLPTSFSK